MDIKPVYLFMTAGIATISLLFGGLFLSYGLSQHSLMTPPTAAAPEFASTSVKITPPPSLSEIAATVRPEYPELADLLENPELSSVYKDFYLTYQQGGKEAAMALARQRNIINPRDEIIMTLTLDTNNTAPLIAELQTEGILVYGHYENLINIAIPLSLIETQLAAESPELVVERISNLEHVIRLGFPKRARVQQSQTEGQGVHITLADQWHTQGITGAGIKVGVLDLGFAHYSDLLGAELPTQVTVARFGDGYEFDQERHGTACAEIIHEMAPDAELYLAYFDGTDAAMGQAVDWLIAQNVDIISNSTNSFGTTPMDGSGFSAELVDKAHNNGILWVNSAGNYAERHYRGQFTDLNGDNLHDFDDPEKQVLPFIASPNYETRIVLTWDDWEAVDQDYELILYDESGNVLAKSEEPQTGDDGQEPVEGFLYTFDKEATYLLSIENYAGATRGDATFDLFIEPSIMHPDFIVPDYSLGSPADAEQSLSVGATYWFNDEIELYSSRGPTNDGRPKPDISAPADIDTASYNPETFIGTSAATPHVAGAAALVWQANPQFQADEVKQFLLNRAIDLGAAGVDNEFGAGRMTLGELSKISPLVENLSPDLQATPIIRPTSTPRTIEIVPPTFGTYQPPTRAQDDTDTILGAVIIIGTCLLCLSAMLFTALIGGIVMILL